MSSTSNSERGLDDMIEDDDFLSLTTVGPEEVRTHSQTGQTWARKKALVSARLVWDVDHPPAYDTKVFTTGRVQLEDETDGEIRVYNGTDSEPIQDAVVSSSGEFQIGPEPYTPATTSDPILVRIRVRSTVPGKDITLKSPLVRFGIGG